MDKQRTNTRMPALLAAMLAGGVSAAAVVPARAAEEMRTPDHPAQASREETTGVATGFAVGAAAGGPIGAILGAAAGGWLGDRYHRKDLEQQSLAANLNDSERTRERLGAEMQRLSSSLAESEALGSRYHTTLELTHELGATVHFRTGEATLRPESAAALRRFGAVLASLPDATARVSGFADARGPEQLNLELSRARATAVAAELAAAGVEPERLIVEGYGKSLAEAPESDIDGNAFERRVSVSIERSGTPVARRE